MIPTNSMITMMTLIRKQPARMAVMASVEGAVTETGMAEVNTLLGKI
jgi:hypothetical protein